jgi:hypothetical protein
MKKIYILIIITLAIAQGLLSQISSSVQDYYGVTFNTGASLGLCSSGGSSSHSISVSSLEMKNLGQYYIKNSIITKKITSSTNYFNLPIFMFDSFAVRIPPTANTNYNIGGWEISIHVNGSILKTNGGNLMTTVENPNWTALANWNNSTDHATLIAANANLNNNLTKIIPTTNWFPGTYSSNLGRIWHVNLLRNAEVNENVRIFNGNILTCNSGWPAGYVHKLIKSQKYIVTDPINWSTHNGFDYKYDGNSISTSSLTGTKASAIPQVCDGAHNPRIFLDMNTSIVDTLWNNVQADRGIFAVYLYKNISGTWTFQSSSKTSFTLDPASSYFFRYFYQLADDPATTSGIQYGYRDVYVNTKANALAATAANQNISSIILCSNDNSYNSIPIKTVMLTGSAINYYNTYSDTLGWQIKLWNFSGGYWHNATVYGSGKGNDTFNLSSLPINPANTRYEIVMTTSTSNLCNHVSYYRSIYRLNNTKPSIGADQLFCSNAAAYTIPNSPTGGTFNTVTGLSGNSFSPSAYSVTTTNIPIVYTFTNSDGCIDRDTALYTVYANPKPSITDKIKNFCNNEAPHTMIYTPLGGTFSTNIVTSFNTSTALFTPTTAPIGLSEIYYSVNNGNGCFGRDTAKYTVLSNPKPSIGIDRTICSNTSPITINPTISGGSYNSISGLSGSVFTPSLSNIGSNGIVYTINHANGCTNGDTAIFTVNSNPKPSIGSDQSFCQFTAANYTIPNTPVGGTFKTLAGGSVPGLTGSSYNPTVAGVGTNTVIYEVNNGSGCLHFDTAIYTVNANPKPSLGTDQTYCSNAAAYAIPNSPTGGTFNTVTGLSGNVFTHSIAAIGVSNITYVVSNGNGCTHSDTLNITVNSNPKPSIGSDQPFCQFTTANYTIPNSPVGGTFKTLAGGSVPGLTGSSYNPTSAGIGANTVIYEVNNGNGCLHFDTAIYTVNANPKPSLGADQTYCANAAAYTIPNSPTGGTFNTVTGLTGNSFNPSTAAIGASTITYVVNNGSGCTHSDTLSITVNSNPKPSIGSDQSFCQFTAANYTIPNTPVGGTFKTLAGGSVPGLTGSSYNPTVAGVGANTVIYEVNNGSGCLHFDTAIYTVNANPKPSLGGSQSFCSASPAYTIPNNPSGGTFNSVTGLSGNVFTPSVAGVGAKTITYVVNNGNGCSYSDTITMTVFSSPPAIVVSQDTIKTCNNYGNVDLVANVVSPAGVIWSGSGISSNQFNPSAVSANNTYMAIGTLTLGTCSRLDTVFIVNRLGINLTNFTGIAHCSTEPNYNLNSLVVTSDKGGKHYSPLYPSRISNDSIFNVSISTGSNILKYYKVVANGCSDTVDYTMTVNANPKPSIGIDLAMCSNAAPITLNPTITGGIYITTIGLSSGVFTPSLSNVGVNTIIYNVNNGNGCLHSDTAIFTVNANPKPSLGADQTYCSNATAYSIPNSPTGGTFNTVTGLTGNSFSPSIAAIGVSNITYVVSNGNGCTHSDTLSITVNSNPKPSIGANQSFCQFTAANYTIPNSPVGGTFKTLAGGSVPGLIGSSYNPTFAGVGANTVIYEVNNGSGCLHFDTAIYTVSANPKPSLGADQTYCANAAAYTIPNSPTGGTFNTVTGLTGNSFNPSTAAIGVSNIFYTVNNGSGCTNSDTLSIFINTKPSAPSFIKNIDSVCTIVGNLPSNITLKTFYGITVASGINETWLGSSQSGGVTNINALSPGTTYNFNLIQTDNNNCKDTSLFRLKSNNGSNSTIGLTTTYDTICHTDGVVNLSDYNTNIKGGIWSYATMPSAIQSNKNLTSGFLPINTIITVTYTADTSGCSVTRGLNLMRYKPSVYAGLDKNLCSNGESEILLGSPSGGVWSIDTIGTFVSVFNPGTLSITQSNLAKTYNLFYRIDNGGCHAYDTAAYTVIKKPNATFVKSMDSVCQTNGTLDMTVRFGVNPTNGIWLGQNLLANVLDLNAAGTGTKTHKYITQNSYGCTDTTTYTTRVDGYSATGILDTSDYKVCEASAPIRLNQFKMSPSIGVWSGSSIIDTLFYPNTTGTGIFTVNYRTNNKSCMVNLSKKLNVVAKPATPEIDGKLKYCKGDNFSVNVKSPNPILSYKWQYNSATANASSISGAINGTIQVKLIALNDLACESFSKEFKLELDTPNASGILASKTSIVNAEEIELSLEAPSSNIASYSWDFGDKTDKASVNSVKHIFYNPSTGSDATYNVECVITSPTGCKKTLTRTITVLKRTSSGIEDETAIVSIYPNPVSDYIIVKDDQFTKPTDVFIYDMAGKVVLSSQTKGIESRIDLSGLSVGSYMVRYLNQSYKITIAHK